MGNLRSTVNMESEKLRYIKALLQNFFSELIGTAILVFLGCLGVCKGFPHGDDHTGVILSFSFSVFIAVQVTCHISGGHVNPAVTILSLFFKKMTYPMALVYIIGQIIGGIVGFGLLKVITPPAFISVGFEELGLCSTVPNKDLKTYEAFLAEFLLTSLLLLVVCSAWDPRNSHHDSLTIKFGFTIYALAYGGVAYTGCSMNPARSFGPAVWNNTWNNHWIYWVAPIMSALVCGFCYTFFFCPKIPPPQETFPEKSDKGKENIEMNL